MPRQRQGDAWGVTTRPKILGQLLVEITDLDEEALVAALAQQRTTGLRIGETLVRLGRVTTGHVASALATQFALQYMPAPLVPTREALKAVRPELARQHRVVPLGVSHRTIQIAMADPLDLNAMDDLRFQTGRGTGVPLGGLACPACGRQRARLCGCGRILERSWRFCLWCVRHTAA